jgi:hypothetical protein
MEETTITTGVGHGIEKGDTLAVTIEHSLWKLIWYWLIRKNLKRHEYYTIESVSESTLTVEGHDGH